MLVVGAFRDVDGGACVVVVVMLLVVLMLVVVALRDVASGAGSGGRDVAAVLHVLG